MKQLLIIGLVVVSVWANIGLTWADTVTLGQIQSTGTVFYAGVVAGAVRAWMGSGIVRCEGISGPFIVDILDLHPEWSAKPFEIAVALAMESTGCTYDYLESLRLLFKAIGEKKP